MEAIIVVDLGFGDAGKGSVVDFLTRERGAHTVVRFNGGAQAAHNVITSDGRHHTFAQFGSGTFVPDVETHLSRFMLFDPISLIGEERHLRSLGISDAFERLTVDENAPVVTPFQRAANRLREVLRGEGRHGSCGMGIGETMADLVEDPLRIVRARDLRNPSVLREKLRVLQTLKLSQFDLAGVPRTEPAMREIGLLADPRTVEEFTGTLCESAARVRIVPSGAHVFQRPATVIFEGAQGVLIDEWFGFHPYTTWSTTNFDNALSLLKEHHFGGRIRRIGLTRAYMTRHGAGPFPTEDTELTSLIPDTHNGLNDWQQHFRVGWLDLPLLRYALKVTGGADELGVTCLDRIQPLPSIKVCRQYANRPEAFFEQDDLKKAGAPDLLYQESLGNYLRACDPMLTEIDPGAICAEIEHATSIPVTIRSSGPTARDKLWTKMDVGTAPTSVGFQLPLAPDVASAKQRRAIVA